MQKELKIVRVAENIMTTEKLATH